MAMAMAMGWWEEGKKGDDYDDDEEGT